MMALSHRYDVICLSLGSETVCAKPTARLYAAELVLALEHMHGMSVVYRDVKPEVCVCVRAAISV